MNYIIIYLEIKHLLNFLSQEEKGDFLDLLIEYGENQEIPNVENKNVLNVFNFIKDRLDKQIEKAKIKAEIARENGKKGGRTPKPTSIPKEPNSIPKKPSGFTPPTLQQVKDYCNERVNNIDPNKFINHYQAKGWLVGKVKMKDWKAAVRTWEGNEKQITTTTGSFDKSKWDQYV